MNIVMLAGDGVGPEVAGVARDTLAAVGEIYGHKFSFEDHLIGGIAIDRTGEPLPDATTKACLAANAVFLGAVGGPKWDGQPKRPEQGLLGIRKALGLFANLRPTRVFSCLADSSPLKQDIVRGVDFVMFRELTGGVYFGEKKREADKASDLCVYSVGEVERIARVAFIAAQARRKKVTSVDKANVMETSRLWRETVNQVAKDYPDVALEHQLVDSMSMNLIRHPRAYDVILTENMFGDILSDEASVLGGSIGLGASASLGAGGLGLYEPIHGSAPDIAGQDKADPIGSVLSAAMLLRFSLGLEAEADAVDRAVETALESGARTADLGGTLGCKAMGETIIAALRKSAR